MDQPSLDAARRALLTDLRQRFSNSPFLSLGQTVFWDEPMKAVLRRLLDEYELGGAIVLGVHDTDYFAKSHVRSPHGGRFALMPHNDGTTRDLWSAAGEISAIFGSETFPSRHELIRNGVPLDLVANAAPDGRQAFVDQVTEAWGWRGLVYTGSRDLIVHHLALAEVRDGIAEMLRWGFEHSVTTVMPDCCHAEARQVADRITAWCTEFCDQHPAGRLTDLYQHLQPRLWELLLGRPPSQVGVTCTANLLRLNAQSAQLPRFRLVHHFLDPKTRDIAVAAYNAAVSGSEIYTLDRFGAGALPFDVIVPPHGRGTLRVTPRVLFVETRQPVAIRLDRPIESIDELAGVLNARFGDCVTLVGKAVSLISMLAAEFIFVFNEEGSTYVWRTRQMNDRLAAAGIAMDLRPLLRLRYKTWDALAGARSTLRLPRHLAAAFGRPTITGPEFADSWRAAVSGQRSLCERIAAIRKPAELLEFLRVSDPVSPWAERIAECDQAREGLGTLRVQAERVRSEMSALYLQLRECNARSQDLQRYRGEHFRSVSSWTAEETSKRNEFGSALQELEVRKREVRGRLSMYRQQLRAIDRGAAATMLRAKMREIRIAAETARLFLIRDASLTISGLPHVDHRPSAWWLPMVDGAGDWFRNIVRTVELYTEPLLSDDGLPRSAT